MVNDNIFTTTKHKQRIKIHHYIPEAAVLLWYFVKLHVVAVLIYV